jgi:hypothetical protein
VFGDLWDMFWNHHWFSKKYLGPLTIILLSNRINKVKNTQTHRAVIFD